MPLTLKQVEKLKSALARFWENATCEVCHANEWKTSGDILQLREFKATEPVTVVPVIAVHCKNCGNTKLISAIAIGLVDPKTGELVNE